MSNSSPLNGEYIPIRNLTKGFKPVENKPINFLEIFRQDLKIWCKQNNKSREEFCDLIRKPYHWINKVLTGDWNIAVQDIGRICFVLQSRRIMDAIETDWEGYDAQFRLVQIEEEKRELVQQVSSLCWESRRIQKQMKGE